MILLPIMLRQNKIVNINSSTNNVNLYTLSGSPAAPVNIYCTVNASISSSSNTTYAFQTGTGWNGGSYIYIKNSNTISGTPGSNGTNGNGGAGGRGGDSTATAYYGKAGSAGTSGTNGTNGGPSFAANNVSGVKILLNNLGTISGGSGGTAGLGGGGGGGGGAAWNG